LNNSNTFSPAKRQSIIPNGKYNSFPIESRNRIENKKSDKLKIKDIKVKNPNNPVSYIDCKLITIQIRDY